MQLENSLKVTLRRRRRRRRRSTRDEPSFFALGKNTVKNNYLFDKKKATFFFTGFFRVPKNSRFITNAGGGAGARVIKRMFLAREKKRWKKVFFFIGYEVVL
jgi:hypothetical protein